MTRTALLDVQDVTKTFTSVRAVDGVSFRVHSGEIFALLGPNGAGKTTLLRMLVGLTHPDAGSVRFDLDGTPKSRLAPAEVGYLPEERGLYQDVPLLRTLVHFAALRGMPKVDAEREAREWLERFALGDRAREPLRSLSKGNQQKVQFASAVLHRPRFVILDEPFSGLDPVNQNLFVDVIRDIRARGTTVLLSAHQMQLVERLADRVLLLSRGRAVLRGTLDELRRSWGAANRLVLGIPANASTDFLRDHPAVQQVDRPEPASVVVLTRDGADLGELLVAIGSRLEVHSLHADPVTLHEIYVRAVEPEGGDASQLLPGTREVEA